MEIRQIMHNLQLSHKFIFEFLHIQAALAGKQVLLQGLEQQSVEARQALDSEIQQLQQAKRSAKAAQQAAQQALNHVTMTIFSVF